VKHCHSWDTSRNSLNIDSGINNERQDCEIGPVCVRGLVGVWGRVGGGDEGEGI
jgi:hypothetical protein